MLSWFGQITIFIRMLSYNNEFYWINYLNKDLNKNSDDSNADLASRALATLVKALNCNDYDIQDLKKETMGEFE